LPMRVAEVSPHEFDIGDARVNVRNAPVR
jgi:hypothetical protein